MKIKIIQLVHFPSLKKAKEEPLKSNLKELKLKSDSIFVKRDAINKNLVRELKNGKMPTRECHTWLKKVVEIEQQAYDLLELKERDSGLEVTELRARLVMVLNEIAEYLEKSPNKNGTVLDDAVNGRSKRMKASKIGGCNENQTRKIREKAVRSSAADGESSNTEGKSDYFFEDKGDVEYFGTKRSIKNQQGYTKPENKISAKKEAKSVKDLDVEAGKTPTKPDVQGAKQTMTSNSSILEGKKSATRNEAVLGAAELPSSSIHDINLPEAETGNTIRCTVTVSRYWSRKKIQLELSRQIGLCGRPSFGS
ncbi:hypothetical protein ACH5RR_037328 [Cinchona calisaya]|uniref:BAG domain-containing protein n=1 Tax=Cinchona calisaya TaxID=153742 RepID=A0ABD2YA47_9GENT